MSRGFILTFFAVTFQMVQVELAHVTDEGSGPLVGLWSLLNSSPIKCGPDPGELRYSSAESPAGWHPEYCNYCPITLQGIVYLPIIRTEIDRDEFTPCKTFPPFRYTSITLLDFLSISHSHTSSYVILFVFLFINVSFPSDTSFLLFHSVSLSVFPSASYYLFHSQICCST